MWRDVLAVSEFDDNVGNYGHNDAMFMRTTTIHTNLPLVVIVLTCIKLVTFWRKWQVKANVCVSKICFSEVLPRLARYGSCVDKQKAVSMIVVTLSGLEGWHK